MFRIFVSGLCFLLVSVMFSGCDNEVSGSVSDPDIMPLPVLWDEPVEADNELDYCLKVSKAAETPCTTCVCTDCYDEVITCYFDEGCTYIRECSFVTGCSGAECLDDCGDVLATYAVAGSNVYALMGALSECATENCTECTDENGATQITGPD